MFSARDKMSCSSTKQQYHTFIMYIIQHLKLKTCVRSLSYIQKYMRQHRYSSWLLPPSPSLSRASSRQVSTTTTTQPPCLGTLLAEVGVVHRLLEGVRGQLRCRAGGRQPPRWRFSSRSTSKFLFNLTYRSYSH